MVTIGTDIAANTAINYINQSSQQLSNSILRLSSGSRLAIPSDDAGGLAVSGNLVARIARLGAATQGSQNAISLAQTTDGFLSTIQSELTRMSELAQEATNGSFGSADRANYNTVFSNLLGQLNSITSNANFDGITLFSAQTLTLAINADGSVDTFLLSTIGGASSLGLSGLSITTTTAALNALSLVSTAITCITTRRAQVNADISKFNFYVSNTQLENINTTAANSRIADVDIAKESTNLVKYNILNQTGISVLAQANADRRHVLTLLTSS